MLYGCSADSEKIDTSSSLSFMATQGDMTTQLNCLCLPCAPPLLRRAGGRARAVRARREMLASFYLP